MRKIVINTIDCDIDSLNTLQYTLLENGYKWSDGYIGIKSQEKNSNFILINNKIYYVDNKDLEYLKDIIIINNKSFIRYLKIKNINYGK